MTLCTYAVAYNFMLLQGLDASLIGVIPYAAVRLGMYDGLKKLHEKVILLLTYYAGNDILW